MIAVTFQHPTPYFDDSYAINSANAGPYGDAIMTELIPRVEETFRIVRQPYARLLAGSSTGGWGSLALLVHHPDFFGGTWSFSPDPVDFHRYYGAVDLYGARDAFNLDDGHYLYPVRNGGPGNRRYSQELRILGAEDGGLAWSNLTPVGDDGYPRPVWNLATGAIDRGVVEHMRAHDYDLREYLERNWNRVGPQLIGKIHVYCGDDDTFYLNLAVYLLEDFLENTRNPYYGGSFTYGRPLKRHGWEPTTNAELVRTMARFVASHSPAVDKPRQSLPESH
jgi:S-formylglutathione hydrolase FrmB